MPLATRYDYWNGLQCETKLTTVDLPSTLARFRARNSDGTDHVIVVSVKSLTERTVEIGYRLTSGGGFVPSMKDVEHGGVR